MKRGGKIERKETVLVVDDESKILEIVESYLKKDGYQVVTAKTGKDALAAFEKQPISLVLLDLMLPDTAGEEVCKIIRATSDVPIIMMTAKVDDESVIGGLGLGADDYVTKPFSPRQLMARVSAALRRSGGQGADTQTIRSGNLMVDLEKKEVTKNGQPVVLTPNEYRILVLLMSHPGKVYSRDEIITGIKSDEFEGFDRTIDSHVKNLRQKIEDDPKAPHFVVTVYGMGYRFGGEVSK